MGSPRPPGTSATPGPTLSPPGLGTDTHGARKDRGQPVNGPEGPGSPRPLAQKKKKFNRVQLKIRFY